MHEEYDGSLYLPNAIWYDLVERSVFVCETAHLNPFHFICIDRYFHFSAYYML